MSSRTATVVSTVFSFVTLTALIIILPLFHTHVQWTNTLMRAQLQKCHHDSNEIWRQIAHEGVRRHKRQYGQAAAGYASGQCCSCQMGGPGHAGVVGKPGRDGNPGIVGTNGRNGRPGRYVSAEEHREPPCQKCPSAPVGPPGHPGPKGPRGPAGKAGTNGIHGIPGRVGPPGPMGIRGPPGEFGMQGPEGDRGKVLNGAPPGPSGRPGKVGPRGKAGSPGRDGAPGIEGTGGQRGLEGERGPKGVKGPPGPPGTRGPRGPQGTCVHCDKPSSPAHHHHSEVPSYEAPAPAAPPAAVQVTSSRQTEEEIDQYSPSSSGNYHLSAATEEHSADIPVGHFPHSTAVFDAPPASSPVQKTSGPSYLAHAVTNFSPDQEPLQFQNPVEQAAAQPPLRVFASKPHRPQQQQQVQQHQLQQHQDVHSFEPSTPFTPKPEEVKPAGYAPEQLELFSQRGRGIPPHLQAEFQRSMAEFRKGAAEFQRGAPKVQKLHGKKTVTTHQGYSVDLVGGYAANPHGRLWDEAEDEQTEN